MGIIENISNLPSSTVVIILIAVMVILGMILKLVFNVCKIGITIILGVVFLFGAQILDWL